MKENTQAVLAVPAENLHANPPQYEALVGGLAGAHLRRINIQYRLVYQVLETERVVKVLRMCTHYEQPHVASP